MPRSSLSLLAMVDPNYVAVAKAREAELEAAAKAKEQPTAPASTPAPEEKPLTPEEESKAREKKFDEQLATHQAELSRIQHDLNTYTAGYRAGRNHKE